jgi:hypothetical protein
VESALVVQHPNEVDHRRPDVASIVLGRPTHPNPLLYVSTTSNHHQESMSRKKHRRRSYRDRWEFGCTLEIGTTMTDTYENIETDESPTITECFDGDAAGGAAIPTLANSSTQEQLSTPPETINHIQDILNDIEGNDVHGEDDDDLLSFIAFPVAHGGLSS